MRKQLEVGRDTSLAGLKRRMHMVVPLNGEGAIRGSVRKMSVSEASECAESVVYLYRELLQRPDTAQQMLSLSGDEQHAVPPFLVKSLS